MNKHRGCFWILLCPIFVSQLILAQNRRNVSIEWEPKPDASEYEIQVSKTAELDQILFEKKVKESKFEVPLDPGTYYYRLRFFNKAGKPGPWSDIDGFVVNSAPPKAVFPANGSKIAKKLPTKGMEFKWTQGVEGTKSQIEINDSYGAVLSRSANGNTLQWVPPHPGKFTWKIGYQSISGIEWGQPAEFEILKSALPNPKVKIVKVKVEAKWRLLMIQGALAVLLPGPAGSYPDANGNPIELKQDLTIFGELFWNPELNLNTSFTLRGILGGGFADTFIREKKEEKIPFFIYKTALMFSWAPPALFGFGLELGPGAQYRFFYSTAQEESALYAAGYANIFLKVGFLGLKWVDRVHAGYEIANTPVAPYKAIKLATVFSF